MQKNSALSAQSRGALRIGSDRSVRPRWHSWHSWKLFGLGAVLASSTLTAEASACGATPAEVYPLLPVAGQEGVPLNAVLSVAPSLGQQTVTVELRQKGTEELLETTVDACPSNLCTAVPTVLLANTEYEYRGVMEFQDQESLWTSFTTGSSTSDASPDVSDVVATVISADPKVPPNEESSYPCGYQRRAQIEFDVASVTLPVAIVDGATGPDFYRPPLVISDEKSGTLGMHFAPDCFRPLLIDTLGNRVELDEVCLPEDETTLGMGGGESAPPKSGAPIPAEDDMPTVDSSNDEQSTETRESGGCSVGPLSAPRGGHALWALLGLGLTRLRRRRVALSPTAPRH